MLHRARLTVLTCIAAASPAFAQLSLVGQFPAGSSEVGGAFDPISQTVAVYPSFGAQILRFTAAGAALPAWTRPGGSANDADLDYAPVAFTMNGVNVPAGSLLYIDGESGAAEIYAMDAASGAVIATLATAFGSSHVVGGAYHPQRGTFFLVQDRVPSGSAEDNRVAEINPATGAVISTWQITTANPAFTVNFGDLDIAGNGNLFIVSSDEAEIAEMTPAGAWVAGHALPPGPVSLCGIGVDPTGCSIRLFGTAGSVWTVAFPNGSPQCGRPACDGDVNCDFALDGFDVETMEKAVGGDLTDYCLADPDFNGDFALDGFDVEAVEIVVGGGPCP